MRKILILSLLAFIMSQTYKVGGAAGPGGRPYRFYMQADDILRHVVLLKFKDNSSAAKIKAVEDAFLLLPSKIDLIKGFEWGINNSPEKLNEGLTHCFFVNFASEKDRDEYLVHPAHNAFVEVLKPVLDKVVVIDYWAKK